ncbi:hypothetical protein SUDANB145_03502 [Streptomyces sp. enrichment culture]
MLTTLNTAYTDTRAADLAWALGREPLPALATLEVELAEGNVELRLLGASHQVLLEEGRGICSETVACIPGSRTPLPLGVAKRVGDWEYEFAAHVELLSPDAFAGRAQELLALVSDHPHGLVGVFPGNPYAFTALLVQGQVGQVSWRTWHAYPQEGRLVATRTRVGVCAEAARPGRPGGGGRPGACCCPAVPVSAPDKPGIPVRRGSSTRVGDEA